MHEFAAHDEVAIRNQAEWIIEKLQFYLDEPIPLIQIKEVKVIR